MQGLISLSRTCFLYRVTTSKSARVRLYATPAAALADLTRPVNTFPGSTIGLIMEVVSSSTDPVGLVLDLTPAIVAGSLETTPTNDFSITVDTTTSGPVTVEFWYLPMEGTS